MWHVLFSLALVSTASELTICEAIRQAAAESPWPIAIESDVACGERRTMHLPSEEKRRRSAQWALDEAVSYDGLLVEEHRAGSKVRSVTPDERALLDGLATTCMGFGPGGLAVGVEDAKRDRAQKKPKPTREPARRPLGAIVASVQTTQDGARGWISLSPTEAEKTPAGRCVVLGLKDTTRARFPDDTVVKVRVGSLRKTTLAPSRDEESTAAVDDALARAMEEHGPRVMRCFANARDTRGAAAQVQVRFTLASGAATQIEVVSSTAEGDVPGCVTDRLALLHFDDPVLEGRRVTYTFRRAVTAPLLGGVPDEMP